jgi:signal peptidase II
MIGVFMILVWIPVVVLILDRLSKWLVQTQMAENESIPIIENIFHLTYILNSGAAFGMLEGSRFFFLGVALVAIVIIWWYRKEILREDLFLKTGVALFLGGTLGNVWDRMTTGLVIDFLDFRIWPVFNVADIAICVGVGLIIWSILQEELKKKQNRQ